MLEIVPHRFRIPQALPCARLYERPRPTESGSSNTFGKHGDRQSKWSYGARSPSCCPIFQGDRTHPERLSTCVCSTALGVLLPHGLARRGASNLLGWSCCPPRLFAARAMIDTQRRWVGQMRDAGASMRPDCSPNLQYGEVLTDARRSRIR
eukprot:2208819-Pyramimonas_sp.AAC.1